MQHSECFWITISITKRTKLADNTKYIMFQKSSCSLYATLSKKINYEVTVYLF